MSIDIPNKREEDREVWTDAKDFVRDSLKARKGQEPDDMPHTELMNVLKAKFAFKYPGSAERIVANLKDHGSIHIARKVDGVDYYAIGPLSGDIKIEFTRPVVEAAPENMPPPEPKSMRVGSELKELTKGDAHQVFTVDAPVELVSGGTLTHGVEKKYVCKVEGCTYSSDDPHGYCGHMATHSGRPRKKGWHKKVTIAKETMLTSEQAEQEAMKKIALETAATILAKADEELAKAFGPETRAKLNMVSAMMERAGFKCDSKGPLELRDCLKATLAQEGRTWINS
ncbi:MAG: hypothetical protein WC554_07980 [Clostridia bacterium]